MNDLVSAYGAAEYHVFADPPFVMKVGLHSAALEALLARTGVKSAFFITAYNPFSNPKTDQENEAANDDLRKLLGPIVLPGAGRDPSGQWPQEKSFLVCGDKQPVRAYALARQFGQNAFLWIAGDCVPMLLISNKEMMTDQDKAIEHVLTAANSM
jgi:hypothetical protein